MAERPSSQPARWTRLKHPFLDLTVPKCEECGKGHIPARPVCPDRISIEVNIDRQRGEVFVSPDISNVEESTS